ncbi:aldo/keto reductase [Asanoa siamensis]|uniref:Oxidoreductase n=1 Tax=Asanoa siamensis TaxID=926357 RepID=A0ABQ4CPP4_9ACTN|nr:aldo/keto reductase [Asanoa siamensis]GIF73250.1 oxidoreductase [Asanoa siamensis]
MSIPPLTLGASMLGNRAEGVELATALLRSPYGAVDTSNNYADGRSESLLGDALRSWSEPTAPATLYSKADADPTTGVFDGDRVWRSWEETTKRLGVERLPMYHLHDPYGMTVAEAAAPGGAIEALVALRAQGLVGSIGIAAGRRRLVEEYVRTDVFNAVLTHNRYTLVDQSAAGIIEAATERGMTVFNAAPFGGGILAGSSPDRYAYQPARPEVLAFVSKLSSLCASWDVPLAAAALHFSLRSPLVHSTVVGVSSLARLAALDELVAVEVPDGFFEAVGELGTPPVALDE